MNMVKSQAIRMTQGFIQENGKLRCKRMAKKSVGGKGS